jgi:hypothetical protein
MSKPKITHAYIGVQNGECHSIMADLGDKDTAKYVADLIRKGSTVERITLAEAKKGVFGPWPKPSATP